MRPKDASRYVELTEGLRSFVAESEPLPGVDCSKRLGAFVEQLLESIRRVRYVEVIRSRAISANRADPDNEIFDPLRAAIVHARAGDHDEATWLVFLFVHFGKHRVGGWRYLREVYGRLGESPCWSWYEISSDPSSFRRWLDRNIHNIQREGAPGGFGNHRKYQSLNAYRPNGTGDAIETYVEWVSPPRSHDRLFRDEVSRAGGDPGVGFDLLYQSMGSVASFGRTARFDYLAMLGKLGLAAIHPGRTYIQNATGPKAGAKLLLRGSRDARVTSDVLESALGRLGAHLGIGMQELEDALCNWQKSPGAFRPFRG